ncbi:chaperonin Cpn60 / TCP-1 family protein [TM7 phage DolZOral124_53_65]|nr:chaperonin Cpn60 / TCP-1 family protein [TM7 phage DolZOral124_53_65]
MPKRNLVRQVIDAEESQRRIECGINTVYDVALASYGLKSGNVLIEHRYGEPLISHDGITNIDNLVLSDPLANAAVSVVRQASEKTNRNAGDSTTLTVILTKLAYDFWSKANPNQTIRNKQSDIQEFVDDIRIKIDAQRIKCTPELLRQVSCISAGDKAIGHMVADAVEKVNHTGSVTVVETPENLVSSEVIDGFTFKKGIRVPALADDLQSLKTRYDEPGIIIMPKLITKNDEILPILDKAIRAEKTPIVLIADVSGQALESIVANKLKGALNIAVVEPPVNDRDSFLNDVAVYASTKQYTGRAEDFDVDEYVGTADSVTISLSETTINGCRTQRELDRYIKGVSAPHRLEQLRGKTVRISVGAPTQAERQEMKLRIEDAVCAAQTAYEYGVLPGGGVFLRDAMPATYVEKPFELLTGCEVRDFLIGGGVDLDSGRPVDVVKAGIVDSAKAIEEAVINSHSAAAQLLSINTSLVFAEDMD